MVRRKQEEIARHGRLARASKDLGTAGAQLLTGLAVSMADPINIASAFVPVVGQSRYAIWLERFGKTGARAARGTIEGAAGAALVEPLILGAAAFDQSDYGYLDSLLNVVFGSVLGGGLHVGFGKVSDYLGRTDPAVREGALRGAVAQTAEGRPVDVAHILRTDPRFAGGEAAFDPLDPRYIRELNDPVRPPPAQEFDLGPALGIGRAETYHNYSRISAEDMRYIEDVVAELRESHSGHRLFQDNPFGPGQEIIGVKATTPEWFQRLNEEATRNRQERRTALKKARRRGSAEDVKGGDFGPEAILTRKKVEDVFDKLQKREPLGREEAEIAAILFDEARARRMERIDHILEMRQARADEARAELDAFAARELEDAQGRIDLGPDEEAAIRSADEAEAVARKTEEGPLPDDEAVTEELEFLTGEIEAMRRQGALTDEDLAAEGLRVTDTEAAGRRTAATEPEGSARVRKELDQVETELAAINARRRAGTSTEEDARQQALLSARKRFLERELSGEATPADRIREEARLSRVAMLEREAEIKAERHRLNEEAQDAADRGDMDTFRRLQDERKALGDEFEALQTEFVETQRRFQEKARQAEEMSRGETGGGPRLEASDLDETVKAYGDAAEAAARCLLIHP
jgi:hypothetical protein